MIFGSHLETDGSFFTSCGLHAVILIFIAVYLVEANAHDTLNTAMQADM